MHLDSTVSSPSSVRLRARRALAPRFELPRLAITPEDAVVAAAAAMAVLVLRVTREERLALRVAPCARPDAAITLHLEADLGRTLGALAETVRAELARGSWAAEATRLSWSDASGATELSFVVSLEDGRIDLERSRHRGVAMTPEPLAALADQLERARQAVQTRPETRIADVRLLRAAERARVLAELSASELLPELAAPGLLHTLFEAHARGTPGAIAAEEAGVAIGYGELDARAERLAGHLRARGIGPGDFVALWLPRSADAYAALLGVLKSGAAYVPLDPETPVARVAQVMADCKVAALITTSSQGAPASGVHRIVLDGDWDDARPVARCDAPTPRAPRPEDLAYVIYTSGSTGQPKGVAVTHASARHLVLAEQRLFAVTPRDRVLQGFSLAFDAAVEEVWLAFAAGATLVCGAKAAMLDDLACYLTRERVTVLSTVPTLLARVNGDLPTVRLLIVGGEACPEALAARWATATRAMYNTYGPTEATVIATCSRLAPNAPVTLGRPIPNYRCYVLDRAGQPAPVGVAGEIHIGGVGLALGYLGKPELTASRFVRCPFAGEHEAPPILYRTGDLGRLDDRGEITFLGRVDDQVKIRGFRIELGEVDAALLACPSVAGACAAVREDGGGPAIVAYVVVREGGPSDVELRRRLGESLPPYMVPSRFVRLPALPTLTSGKVDRRALPAPTAESLDPEGGDDDPPPEMPRGPIEELLARCWCALLGRRRVARDESFFLDLGGHSLLAAQMVSRLRREPAFAGISVRDVYEHPTIATLAASLVATSAATGASSREVPRRARGVRQVPLLCAVAQALGLYAIFAVHTVHWIAPFLTYAALRAGGGAAEPALAAAACALLAVQPALLLVTAAAKWLVVGRYRPGRYPLWGATYVRYWLVERLLAIAPTRFLVGTPLLGAYYRLLGARIGADVHVATDNIRAFDLVTIGSGTALGVDARITGYTIDGGELVVGGATIGARCEIGARAVLAPGARMGDGARVGELSMLPEGAAMPAGARWRGSPASPSPLAEGRAEPEANGAPIPPPRAARRAALTAAYAALAFLLPALAVAALLPGLALLHACEERIGAWALTLAPLVATSFVVLLCLAIVLLKRLAVGRVRPGRYALFSVTALRLWLFERAMSVSLDVLGGLYATLYLNPWLRLLGVKLGRGAEVSTASSVIPELVSIGDDAFVADCVSLGTPRIGGGALNLAPTRIGARAFVGNSAVVPGGSRLGDDALLGCLSIAPPPGEAKAGAAWFGSPPLALPQRQASTAFPVWSTYQPTRKLVAQRLAIEALRVTLPTACYVVLTWLLVDAIVALWSVLSPIALAFVVPLLGAAFGALAALWVVAIKWAVIGRYRSGEHPLWSTFVWRTELVTAMHENLADPLWTQMLVGTPWAAWFFRALGAKIGRAVHLGTTQLTEYDLVSVGDGACLNTDCTVQTHLFEDRVMKVSRVTIGDGASVGAESVVLYDATLEDGASLAPLSLIMKGERLPKGTRWAGSPARPASR